uniref:mitogen-activated protein kinase kinase n=1 Tax=Macrostomum lignano TaxID=282301 RepID=A0A1I8F4Q5_9PLAT
ASPAKSARRFGGVKLALPLNFAEAIEAATRAAKLTDTISQSQSLADVAAFSVDGVTMTARATDFDSLDELGSGRFALSTADIKPSNMLINRSGQVKLCDFGSLLAFLKIASPSQTLAANCYVAPERVSISMATEGGLGAGDEPGFTTASDVWSLGISLLELASGAHPYGSWKNPFHQVQHLTGRPATGRFRPRPQPAGSHRS